MKNLICFTFGLMVAFSVFNVQISSSTPTTQPTSQPTSQPDEW